MPAMMPKAIRTAVLFLALGAYTGVVGAERPSESFSLNYSKMRQATPNGGAASGQDAPGAVTAKVADLAMVSARVQMNTIRCEPGHTLFNVIATVKNIGTGNFPASVTSAGDTHPFPNTNPWGSGVATPALAAGQQATVYVAIKYHESYKDHIPGVHQFRVIANDWGYKNKKGENNFTNNTMIVTVNMPKPLCADALQTAPPPGPSQPDLRMKGRKILEN